jgi:hypothetical protein
LAACTSGHARHQATYCIRQQDKGGEALDPTFYKWKDLGSMHVLLYADFDFYFKCIIAAEHIVVRGQSGKKFNCVAAAFAFWLAFAQLEQRILYVDRRLQARATYVHLSWRPPDDRKPSKLV